MVASKKNGAISDGVSDGVNDGVNVGINVGANIKRLNIKENIVFITGISQYDRAKFLGK